MNFIQEKDAKKKYIFDWWPAIKKWPEAKVEAHLPEIVAVPESVSEVQEAVKYAYDNNLAIVPFGGASGV